MTAKQHQVSPGTVLVTGASGNIGRALAGALLASSARLPG